MGVKFKIFALMLVLFIGISIGIFAKMPLLDSTMRPESQTRPSDELLSPYNRISLTDIHIYEKKVCIELENPRIAEYIDTNSMDPMLDKGTKGIIIRPKSKQDIHLGDIISYRLSEFETPIVHQVVFISEDEYSWYALAKGINSDSIDPYKIRFEQINSILIAAVY